MIVVCDECGKKYWLDPDKMKGVRARVNCKQCGHLFTVSKAEHTIPEPPEPMQPSEDGPQSSSAFPEPEDATALDTPPQPDAASEEDLEPEESLTESEAASVDTTPPVPEVEAAGIDIPRKKGMGLRAKMIFLFFLIPTALIIASGWLYLTQLNKLADLITGESAKMVTQFAERMIAVQARAVSSQIKLYLDSNPDLQRQDFNGNADFKRVAVQKVGMTGYTALYQRPGTDGIWRTWAHVNPKIIGINMQKLKKPLGKNFPGFWKIYSGVKSGREAKGYYTWQDADGSVREKYMVCSPVAGTPFVIAATTYLDEFGRHAKRLETRSNKMRARTQTIVLLLLAGTLVLVGLIVLVSGHRLSGRIKSLTRRAEQISIGDLETPIETKSNDEIGDLADAISRMQASIRLSIDRLRRRR